MSTKDILLKRQNFVSKKLIEQTILKEQLTALEKEQTKQTKRHIASLKTRQLILTAAQTTQYTLQDYITHRVNLALLAVMSNPPEFSIKFVERRNQTECDLMLDDDRETDENHSGGVRDIVSFTLRCLFVAMKNTRRVLILDEPFKNLSVEYHEAAAELVKTLVDEYNLQIIMTTHLPIFKEYADKSFVLKRGGLHGPITSTA